MEIFQAKDNIDFLRTTSKELKDSIEFNGSIELQEAEKKLTEARLWLTEFIQAKEKELDEDSILDF